MRAFILVIAALTPLAACSGRETLAEAAIYCYRSLAEPTCYTKPLPRDAPQLLGWYGPHPESWSRAALNQPYSLVRRPTDED